MDAGQELDMLVAEKVLGLRVVDDPINYRGVQIDVPGHKGKDLPHFSTDWNATGLLIKALRARGLHLQCNDTLSAYRARFFTFASAQDWAQRFADDTSYEVASELPVAICLAALRTVDTPPRSYPTPADLAGGVPPPDDWVPDGIIMRRGYAHAVSIVKEEDGELFVSGLTFAGWIRPEELIRPADDSQG